MFRAESVLRLWTSSRLNLDLGINPGSPLAAKAADAGGPENAFCGLSISSSAPSSQIQDNAHVQLPMEGGDVPNEVHNPLTDARAEIAQLKETLKTLRETLAAQNRMHEVLVAEQEAEISRLRDELAVERDKGAATVAGKSSLEFEFEPRWGLGAQSSLLPPQIRPQRSVQLALPQRKSVMSVSGWSAKRACLEDSFDHEAMAGRPASTVAAVVGTTDATASRLPARDPRVRRRLGGDAGIATAGQGPIRYSTASTLSVPARTPPAPRVNARLPRTPSGVSVSAAGRGEAAMDVMSAAGGL